MCDFAVVGRGLVDVVVLEVGFAAWIVWRDTLGGAVVIAEHTSNYKPSGHSQAEL